MKLLSLPTFIVLSCGGLAAAQNCVATALSVIPSCAQNCILNGATTVGCGGTDFSCQCQKTAALYAAIDECVSSSCPSASYQAVIDGASTVCDCALPNVVARVVGTASVSGISGISGIGPYSGTVPASNTATVTGSVTGTVVSTIATVSTSGSAATNSSGSALSATTSSLNSDATWTGYTSVSSFATASVVGAAAQATPAHDITRYVVLVVMVGAVVM